MIFKELTIEEFNKLNKKKQIEYLVKSVKYEQNYILSNNKHLNDFVNFVGNNIHLKNVVELISLYHYGKNKNLERVFNYNEWKNYGRQIIKGSKSIPILKFNNYGGYEKDSVFTLKDTIYIENFKNKSNYKEKFDNKDFDDDYLGKYEIISMVERRFEFLKGNKEDTAIKYFVYRFIDAQIKKDYLRSYDEYINLINKIDPIYVKNNFIDIVNKSLFISKEIIDVIYEKINTRIKEQKKQALVELDISKDLFIDKEVKKDIKEVIENLIDKPEKVKEDVNISIEEIINSKDEVLENLSDNKEKQISSEIKLEDITKFYKTELRTMMEQVSIPLPRKEAVKILYDKIVNKKLEQEKIALKVGVEFIIIPKKDTFYLDLTKNNRKVIVNGNKYNLYSGTTFEESQKIDVLFDSKKYEIYNINDYLENNINNDKVIQSFDFDYSLDIENNIDNEITQNKNLYKINEYSYTEDKVEIEKNAENLEEKSNTLKIENFKITEELDNLKPSEKLENNINAIRVLKEIEKENREASKEEQLVLSKYVSWGGLADVFDEDKKGQFLAARDTLKDLLTEDEYDEAKESTLTSFYTPKFVIDGIYRALENFGFEKGRILEPSCGVGNFIGNVPYKMRESEFYGVELDSISGRIAKKLYPEANIEVKGYEETNYENNLFDVAIGNIPFGNFKVFDKEYNKHNLYIHDYFFAKTIDKVRAGGIIAFITSTGTLDKKDDRFRKYIDERCEMLGAIRLPQGIFKGLAGTDVASDIIFLQKRETLLKRDFEYQKIFKDTFFSNTSFNNYFY